MYVFCIKIYQKYLLYIDAYSIVKELFWKLPMKKIFCNFAS